MNEKIDKKKGGEGASERRHNDTKDIWETRMKKRGNL